MGPQESQFPAASPLIRLAAPRSLRRLTPPAPQAPQAQRSPEPYGPLDRPKECYALPVPKLGSKEKLLALATASAIAAAAWPALADRRVVLHEYFAPDAQEDLLLRATTLAGTMPAAIETPAGVLRAPDANRSPYSEERAYGGTSTPTSADSSYSLDRDTTRPDTVGYDDPFNPAVTPFKRLYAYDGVDANFELVVRKKELRLIPVGGSLAPGEDQFYGDMVVDLVANEPVRIPSVGPGTRILAAEIRPTTDVELLADGADNWFIRAKQQRRVRMTMELAIRRSTFGGQFPDIPFTDLPAPLPLPGEVQSVAQEVLTHLGLTSPTTPKKTLESLVSYFRNFAPSPNIPDALTPASLYRTLAFSQKGVCRHRAFAFAVTALAASLPTRFVRNEAHAWVEVYDGKFWHRIDLGGAANHLDIEPRETAFQHVPPPDPFRWPEGSESTAETTRRTLAAQPSPAPNATPAVPSNLSPSSPAPLVLPSAFASVASNRPASRIELQASSGDVRRGALFKLSGRMISDDGDLCRGARLDVALVPAQDGAPIPLGSLPTDSQGAFAGAVSLRSDIELGEYQLLVSSPGTPSCGPARSH